MSPFRFPILPEAVRHHLCPEETRKCANHDFINACMPVMNQNNVVITILPYMREAQKPLSSSRYAISSSESDSAEHVEKYWLLETIT